MAGIRIEIRGADKVHAGIAEAMARLEQPKPMFDEIGRALTVSTQRRFETGKDPEGNVWPKSLRAMATGGKTMVDTSQLVGSITHEASQTGVAVGTNVIYAAAHQFGATITAKNSPWLAFSLPGGGFAKVASVTLPKRAYLGLDADDEKEIVAIIADFVLTPLGGSRQELADG